MAHTGPMLSRVESINHCYARVSILAYFEGRVLCNEGWVSREREREREREGGGREREIKRERQTDRQGEREGE